MKFAVKPTKEKVNCSYKTLYIADDLAWRITEIAKEHGTSFNNIVVSMIESCLAEEENDPPT